MKNLTLALTILALATTGLAFVIMEPGIRPDNKVPVATAAAEPATPPVETTDENSVAASQSPANEPLTMCNALGTPIPVIRDQSALHDPRVVEKLRAKVPGNILKQIRKDPPTDLPQELTARIDGMKWIPGGVTVMGCDSGIPDEAPPHPVALDGFWMDATEVTNQQFQKFVEETGYVTLAEQKPKLRSIQPGSELEQLAILEEFNVPGSICSLQLNSRDDIDPAKGAYSWWQYLPGANWKHPEGPESDIKDRMDHPVVHVSWLDAQAYCEWAGKSLPTEAQWEYAARAGNDGNFFPWGNERNPDNQWLQNIWQGTFPIQDTGDDGFRTTAPVSSFPANDFGLYDMSGNVWEWCADYYQPDYYHSSPLKNPSGPDSSFDPQEPGIVKRVQRGGSFMCSDQYCVGYRVSARMKGEEDTGAFHTGFRCVINP